MDIDAAQQCGSGGTCFHALTVPVSVCLCAARTASLLCPILPSATALMFLGSPLVDLVCPSLMEEVDSEWVMELPQRVGPGLEVVKRNSKPPLPPGSCRQSMPAMRTATTHTAFIGRRCAST